MLSGLKCTEESVLCCKLFKENMISSVHRNNTTFADEKSLMLSDLMKLKVWKGPLTGEAPSAAHKSGVSVRKRCNLICAIRPFSNSNCRKILICAINLASGNAELLQRHANLIVEAVFFIRGSTVSQDNTPARTSGEKSELQ